MMQVSSNGEGCGDSKEFAFCGSVSAEPRLKGRFTLASPHLNAASV
jgi:hypothetical protein